jgi:hypothetical protein
MIWIKMAHNKTEKNFGPQNMDIYDYWWLNSLLIVMGHAVA